MMKIRYVVGTKRCSIIKDNRTIGQTYIQKGDKYSLDHLVLNGVSVAYISSHPYEKYFLEGDDINTCRTFLIPKNGDLILAATRPYIGKHKGGELSYISKGIYRTENNDKILVLEEDDRSIILFSSRLYSTKIIGDITTENDRLKVLRMYNSSEEIEVVWKEEDSDTTAVSTLIANCLGKTMMVKQ